MKSVDLYAGRFAGSFDVNAEDASDLDHDTEVTMIVRGLVKELTLKDTRSGELRLAFVIRPVDVQRMYPWQRVVDTQRDPRLEDEVAEVDDEEFDLDDSDPFVPPAAEPTGVRVSNVQPHSNVAGSSQAERDPVLARFMEENVSR